MDMRMSFIGMQGEGVPVLTPEFLTREVSHRSQHLARWRSGRHREHEFMDKLGWLSAFGDGEGCLTPHVVDVEVPVVQQRLTDPIAQALAVIGFQFQLSVAPKVCLGMSRLPAGHVRLKKRLGVVAQRLADFEHRPELLPRRVWCLPPSFTALAIWLMFRPIDANSPILRLSVRN